MEVKRDPLPGKHAHNQEEQQGRHPKPAGYLAGKDAHEYEDGEEEGQHQRSQNKPDQSEKPNAADNAE